MANTNGWGGARPNSGGARPGSGRKKIYEGQLKQRGFSCTDAEWENIKKAAQKNGTTVKKMILDAAKKILQE